MIPQKQQHFKSSPSDDDRANDYQWTRVLNQAPVMIRLGARAPQPPLSPKPQRRPSAVGDPRKRFTGARRSENLRQMVVQLVRGKEERPGVKKLSGINDKTGSSSKVKNACNTTDINYNHGNENVAEMLIDLKNSVASSPLSRGRVRASGVKLRESGLVDESHEAPWQQGRERVVLSELSTNTPTRMTLRHPPLVPHPPPLLGSEDDDHDEAHIAMTAATAEALPDLAATEDFTKSFPKKGETRARKVAIGQERRVIVRSMKGPSRIVVSQHNIENAPTVPERSHGQEQPYLTKQASAAGKSYSQDVHQNAFTNQRSASMRVFNTSVTSDYAQEPSKHVRTCQDQEHHGPHPNRTVRFHTDDYTHNQSKDTSGGRSRPAAEEGRSVRGSAFTSSRQPVHNDSAQRFDYQRRSASIELYKRRLRINQNTFVIDCPTEEDYIISAAGPALPPQESKAPARVVRQSTPFKCSRTRKAMETSMEDRDCYSGSSDNSETNPAKDLFCTPAPQVCTYVLEGDLSQRLDGGLNQPVALTLHNLNLHNALQQRRLEREILRRRRAQRQVLAAGDTGAGTEDVGKELSDSSPEIDGRLKRWLMETQHHRDFKPMVTFKIAAQTPVRV